MRAPADTRGVLNEITLITKVNAAGLNEINHALHRSRLLSPDDAQIAAAGGTVILAGAIQPPRHREVVEATAWAAPGAAPVLTTSSLTASPSSDLLTGES
ncbi:MAG TPA: hypothetical protein VGC15_04615 [Acetobacteraceae bacterium]